MASPLELTTARLTLVDLAGSERAALTGATEGEEEGKRKGGAGWGKGNGCVVQRRGADVDCTGMCD